MEQIYACLWRILRQIALTVLILSLVRIAVPFSGRAFAGFCLYGAALLLIYDFVRRQGHKRETLWVLALLGLCLFFVCIRRREWLLKLYQSYRAECRIVLLLPFPGILLSVCDKWLKYMAPVCLLLVILAAVWHIPVHRAGIIGAIYVMFGSLIEFSGILAYKQDCMQGFFLLPLSLCAVFAVLPVSEKPYPYLALKHVWSSMRSGANALYTELSLFASNRTSSFDLQFTGYSGEGLVGGSLLRDERPAFTLSMSGNVHANLYLAGNIKNQYEYNKWSFKTSAKALLEEELSLDTLELLYAIYRTGTEDRTVIGNASASVTYQGLYTKDMFFPAKLCDFKLDKAYEDMGNKMASKRKLKEGDGYSFRYLVVNYGSDALRELIEDCKNISYQKAITDNTGFSQWIRKYYPQLRDYVPDAGFEAMLSEREDRISQDYMQLPDYLREDVAALTERVTEGAGTDYERLEAIERYLQGFSYTLTPGRPVGDAVEEFLFETGEGYCTYFASAFVLMSRAAGIPARYVSGFCIPVYSMGMKESVVGSDRAHAWPEAYLPGIGWLAFEPAAGFAGYRNTPWSYKMPGNEDQKEASPAPDTEWILETEEDSELYEDIYSKEETAGLPGEIAEAAGRLLLILTGILLTVFVLACLIRLYRRRQRYLQSGEAGKLTLLLCYELSLLGALGLCRRREETLLQYRERLGRQSPPGFLEFIESYMDSFYGRCETGPEDRKAAVYCVRQTELLFKGLHKFTIMYLRFTFSENML